VGFFFGNTELSMELWTTIPGISSFDDREQKKISTADGALVRYPVDQ